MPDPGDCTRNAVNYDVVSAVGEDMATEDKEVIPIFSGTSIVYKLNV
jgi:hypothetical protein